MVELTRAKLKQIVEGVIMASDCPLTIGQILKLFSDKNSPSAKEIKEVINAIIEDCQERGIELKEVASGYRFQVRHELSPWIQKMWQERPVKYSRALLETLALIVYKQPITRAEIEDIRGVAVSSTIIKTLIERGWIRIVAHKEVPGRPALYATTKPFLDDFNLKSLSELPSLDQIQDFKLEQKLPIQLSLIKYADKDLVSEVDSQN